MRKLCLFFLVIFVTGCGKEISFGKLTTYKSKSASHQKKYSKDKKEGYVKNKQKGDGSFFYETRENYKDEHENIKSKNGNEKSTNESRNISDKKHHDDLLNEALNKNSILSALAVKERQYKPENNVGKKNTIKTKEETIKYANNSENDITEVASAINKKRTDYINNEEKTVTVKSGNNNKTSKDSDVKKDSNNNGASKNTEATKNDIKNNKIIKKMYRIQCGNYANKRIAKELADKIKNSGIKDVDVVFENGVNKIFVGSFATKEDGADTRNALKKLGFVKNEFWVYR